MRLLIVVVFLILLNPTFINAENLNVEIFDVKAEKVIKTVPKTDVMQDEATKYIESINDIFKQINPIPETGYMIKIPLDPPVTVDNQWLQSDVDTVIIILPKDDSPYLLTFDEENRPRVFIFKENVETLLKELDFQP